MIVKMIPTRTVKKVARSEPTDEIFIVLIIIKKLIEIIHLSYLIMVS